MSSLQNQKSGGSTTSVLRDQDDTGLSKKERFTFFYHNKSPFSQFHPSVFKGAPLFPETESKNLDEEYTFLHCEQWMMFNKARLFKDDDSAAKILKTVKPQDCKALGRGVKNFVPATWNQHNVEIIYEGNRLKFTQNPNLLETLQKTNGTTLVEASPTDRIYGIGLSATDPNALYRKTWRGENLLGETLTKLREDLKNFPTV